MIRVYLILFCLSIHKQTKKEFEGDITLVVFPFVKELKMNPKEIARNFIKLHLIVTKN